jgi:hypothetical protein
MIWRKIDSRLVIILLILSVLFFTDFILSRGVIGGEDFLTAISYFKQDSLSFKEDGEISLWETHTYSGMPSVVILTMRYYPYYPLFLLLYSEALFKVYYIVHIFLAGLFMYAFMRNLKSDSFSSLIAAVVFMFGGSVISKLQGSLAHSATYALIPLSFLIVDYIVEKKRIVYSAILGVILFFQLSAGHAQFFLYSSTALAFYVLFNVLSSTRERKRSLEFTKYFVATVIVFTLLSSVVFLPQMEVSKKLNRLSVGLESNAQYEYISSHSLPFIQLTNFIMPNLFGNELEGTYWGAPNYSELYIYSGIFPLILAWFALAFRRSKHTYFFLGLTIFALIFAFGKNTPLFYLFYRFIPGFGLFRAPSRMLMVCNFGIAVLAGFGASFITDKISYRKLKQLKRITRWLIVMGVLSLVMVFVVYFGRNMIIAIGRSILNKLYYDVYANSLFVQTHSYESLLAQVVLAYNSLLKSVISFSVILILCISLLLLRIRRKIRMRPFRLLLITLIVVDLWFYGLQFVYVKNDQAVFDATEEILFLKKDLSHNRILSLDEKILPHYLSIRYGIERILGYGLSRISYYDEFLKYGLSITNDIQTKRNVVLLNIDPKLVEKDYSAKLLGLLNVKYILSKEKLSNEDYIKVKDTGNAIVYENRKVLPRAFIVRNAEILRDKSKIFSRLKEESFNPKEKIILEKSIKKKLTNPGKYKEVFISRQSPNEIIVKVDLENPGFLVLSEIYFPGWKAYDNGKEIEIYKTDYVLRSVYLEKGNHEVVFRYKPKSYIIGKVISTFTLLVLAVYFILFLLHQSRSSKQ